VILACTFLIQITSVTDGQTDGRADTWTMAKTREEFCYLACEKRKYEFAGLDTQVRE